MGLRRKDPKALELQQKLLKEELHSPNDRPTSYSLFAVQYETAIHKQLRGYVEDYHDRRGTRNTSIHSARAAKPKYEVPYYFESRRLESELYTQGLTDRKPSIKRNAWLAIKIALKASWIRLKGWIKVYMPLSYDNFNLARI